MRKVPHFSFLGGHDDARVQDVERSCRRCQAAAEEDQRGHPQKGGKDQTSPRGKKAERDGRVQFCTENQQKEEEI
jgi:hypothetical protein